MYFKNSFYALMLTIFSTCAQQPISHIGVTNQSTGGLFGDNTLHYIKSKWLAYKYNAQFYFQPFKYADQFQAFTKETVFSNTISASYSRHIQVRHESDITNNLQSDTLFIIEPYADGEGFNTEDFVNFLILNGYDKFIDSIKPLLSPQKPIPALALPKNIITVAVHIRKPVNGTDYKGFFDFPLYSLQTYTSSSYALTTELIYLIKNQSPKIVLSERFNNKNNSTINEKSALPPTNQLYSDIHNGSTKFPPNQFYIDQIRELSHYLKDIPLYVYLFTNDVNPQQLCKTIEKNVGKKNITYEWHTASINQPLIEDCYLMGQFDCLIKSTSCFSTISQVLGDHMITIIPSDYIWDNNCLIITKTTWFIKS